MQQKTTKMKDILILTIIIPYFCLTQTLPNQYHYSEDGHRLIRGNTELDGLYNESEIKTIYFDKNKKTRFKGLKDSLKILKQIFSYN